ncbi:hypothetical protein ACHHYP_07455 [Achlya hypogyna]|uniref:Guanylate cyclase domain-containing protein n=1 Tax=Achlya hypogyna TaxID=1202772 RepID=A0A1V9ZMC2_ACHHY|nr:hypothetical protein ACHHYP_07455 [Achlya hypogyna]
MAPSEGTSSARISKDEKKELDVLCRYVPRIVLSNYIATKTKLDAPAMTSFTAVVALFDISGFSTLADRLAKEESLRTAQAAGSEIKLRPSVSGKLDISRTASHRRVSTASDKLSSRPASDDAPPTSPAMIKRTSIADATSGLPDRHNSTASESSTKKGISMRTGMAVEQLTRLLNQTLAPVIDIITEHRGDIIKFAGDAMIVMWETESGGGVAVDPGLLVHTAIACALRALEMLRGQTTGGHRLGMHVGMGLSSMTGNHVGGLLNRWEYYIAGTANQQMSVAERDASEGELVVSAECYHALVTSAAIDGLSLAATMLLTGNYRVDGLESNTARIYETPTLALTSDVIPLIKAYVPGCISLSLGKGKLVINGMRSITAIFIKFSDILSIHDPLAQLHEVHRCLCAVQDAAYRVHATIRQFLIDDKGAVAIVIVGLPPFYHENNALHGIRMALYLQEKGIKASIGITSGPAFCGSIGSAVRAEYAVVGDTINLSARLMSLASPGRILCDEATQSATATLFEFDQGSQVLVKGKGTTITVYRVYRDATSSFSTKAHPLDHEEIFLSPDIYDNVIKRIQAFATRFQPTDSLRMPSGSLEAHMKQVILLRGPSGVGKSCLLRHLTKVHPNVVYTSGDSVEKNTPLYVWKKLMSTIICGTNRVKAHRVETPSTGGAGFVVIGRRLSAVDKSKNDAGGSVRLPPPSGSTRTLNLLQRGVSWRTLSTRATEVIVVNPDKNRVPGHDSDSDDSDDDGDSKSSRVDSLASAPRADATVALGSGLAFVNSIVQSGKLAPELLPLLNFFIPHCFPENSYTLSLAANKDALLKEVAVMVVAILQQVSATRPILFVLDDAQWIDGPSWDLLTAALAISTNVNVVVAHRADAAPAHDAFKKLEVAPVTFRWDLANLSLRDTSLFLSHRYGIAIMNSYLLEFVHGRAHGNPRDTITLMERLLEIEAIEIDLDRGVCHVHKDIHEVDMEVSVQTRAKVMYHYDSLSPVSQLALRIASVSLEFITLDCLTYMLKKVFELEYDNSFSPKVAREASADGGSTRALAASQSLELQALQGLSSLEGHGIVKIDRHSEAIEFTSAEIRAVVYNVMLPSQREVIHRVFASWFECEVPHHRLPRFQYYNHLAYHLSRSRMYTEAMDYFTRGAEEALLRGVADFALTCLTAAGDVLAHTDASQSTPGGSSGRHMLQYTGGPSATHVTDADDAITLHQCKIEYLTGLVMIQKSEWATAVEHFQATVAIYDNLRRLRPVRRGTAIASTIVRWSRALRLRLARFTKPTHVVPTKKRSLPAPTPLADQVDAYARVAKTLATQILAAEEAREQASNAIRLLGLKSIFSAKPPSGTTSEATFVAFLPGRKPRRKATDSSTASSRKLPVRLLSQSKLFKRRESNRKLTPPAAGDASDAQASTKAIARINSRTKG